MFEVTNHNRVSRFPEALFHFRSSMRLRTHTIFLVIGMILLACSTDAFPQKRKKKPAKKPVERVFTIKASGSAEAYKPEPFLSLEPCAKETDEQIAELENGTDSAAQVNTLVSRLTSDDRWVRGCAIYRLGEFGSASTDALPVLLKILDDNEDYEFWNLADRAIWNIPPGKGYLQAEQIRDAKSPEDSKRLYAVLALSSFRYPPTTMQAKRAVEALIEALADENGTIVYIAARGLQRQGYWGVDTTSAIPALSELIKGNRVNPLHPLYAMSPMGVRAAPATPLLIEMLLEPKKFVGELDTDNIRAYSLRLTTQMLLGKFGADFVPVLKRYRADHPYEVLGVLSHMDSQESLDLTLEIAKTSSGKLRVKAIEGIPRLKAPYAVKVVPTLLSYLKDTDKDVRNAALSKLGAFAEANKTPTREFQDLYRRRVVPKFVALLNDKDSGCYAALNLPNLGALATSAIPALAKIARRPTGSYCARKSLFAFGDAGRKYLTAEQIKDEEESSKLNFGFDRPKPKEVKPKVAELKKPDVSDTD